jgi:hypothetical protein
VLLQEGPKPTVSHSVGSSRRDESPPTSYQRVAFASSPNIQQNYEVAY